MARNQLEKYLNQLDIRKGGYLEKQWSEYKLARFQKSLEILKRAALQKTIPTEIINEVEKIFKLMPVHELYYIKINKEEFEEYIKTLNALYIRVLDDYEEYIEVISSKSWGNIIVALYLIWLFHESIEKWLGFYILPILALTLTGFAIFQNRNRFFKNPFKFS